ncbi:hypothetical protein MBLNU457_g2645t1 [Dothideomycetes sp. NU457]
MPSELRTLLRRISSRDPHTLSSSAQNGTTTFSPPSRTSTWSSMSSLSRTPTIEASCEATSGMNGGVKDCVRTRVLVLSDTHSAELVSRTEEGGEAWRAFKEPLPAADVVLHCGDMTMRGGMNEYNKTLDMLAKIDAPVKIVIAGNHDRTLDKDWLKENPKNLDLSLEERKAIWKEATDFWFDKNGRAKQEGVTMLEEGVHTINLKNGASLKLYATPYQPEFCNWAFAYPLETDRFNPRLSSLIGAKSACTNPIPSYTSSSSDSRPIDILLTHGPPYANLDRTTTGTLVGCPHLLRALMRSRPLLHCFGHIHESHGAQRIAWPPGPKCDAIATSSVTIKEFKKNWADEISDDGIKRVGYDVREATRKGFVEVDVSKTARRPVQRGLESLLVNAAVMDVQYKPANPVWLVLVDLPEAVEGS